jgi:hypothetical protein
MNWRLILVPVFIAAAIILFFYKEIIGILPFILASLVTILPYLTKPRVSLKITGITFREKEFKGKKGYQVKATITNRGKSIACNLTASVKVNDSNICPVHLSRINAGTEESVKSFTDPMGNAGYVWIDEMGKLIKGSWNELRKNDEIGLLYPEEFGTDTVCSTVCIGDSVITSRSEMLLELESDNSYQVIIEVKGEDPNKETVIGSKKVKIRA